MYFIIFLHYHFVLHDDEKFWDLININKKSLIVVGGRGSKELMKFIWE